MSLSVFQLHPQLSSRRNTEDNSYHCNYSMPSPYTRARARQFRKQSLTLTNPKFQQGVPLLLFQDYKDLNTVYSTQWLSKGCKTFLRKRLAKCKSEDQRLHQLHAVTAIGHVTPLLWTQYNTVAIGMDMVVNSLKCPPPKPPNLQVPRMRNKHYRTTWVFGPCGGVISIATVIIVYLHLQCLLKGHILRGFWRIQHSLNYNARHVYNTTYFATTCTLVFLRLVQGDLGASQVLGCVPSNH